MGRSRGAGDDSTDEREKKSSDEQRRHEPPEPVNPARPGFAAAKLALHELVVVELLLRQAQGIRVRG